MLIPDYEPVHDSDAPLYLMIDTYASLSGWGARCQEIRIGDLWLVKEQEMHINAFDLCFWQ